MKKLTHQPHIFPGGECYLAAFMTLKGEAWDKEKRVIKPTDWRLVHGIIDDGKGKFGHAWLENDDTVYESLKQAYANRDDYYSVNKVTYYRIYTYELAVAHLLKVNTYGYWDPKFAEVQHSPRSKAPSGAATSDS